jgi:hypothetical protein
MMVVLFNKASMLLAYKFVMVSLMLAEVNFASKNLGLPVQLPIRESDLRRTHVDDPTKHNSEFPDRPTFGGALVTGSFSFGFSENGRLHAVARVNPWGSMHGRELSDMLILQQSILDTNGAYRLASNWLSSIAMDITRLETEGSAKLCRDDVTKCSAFAAELMGSGRPVSAYITNKLSQGMRQVLATPGLDERSLKAIFCLELNKIIYGPWIYDEKRFRGVTLRRQTLALVEDCQTSNSMSDLKGLGGGLKPLARCNRMLLEDAYPEYLCRGEGDRVNVEQEFVLQNGVKKLKPIFWVRWSRWDQFPGIVVEIDGRKGELLDFNIHDDTVSRRPVGLVKNLDELLRISDEQFLAYSAEDRKLLLLRFGAITYDDPKPYPLGRGTNQ